jgi:uncharacterized protein (TIGR02246 family)
MSDSDLSYIEADHKLTPEDDAAIRQVVARLNHAIDAADYALYASFFAEECVFASGFGDAIGPKQVEQALTNAAAFITDKRHVAANLLISGEGDEAVVTSYLIVFERRSSLAYAGSAVNRDTLRRHDGKWQIVRHESTLDPATASHIQSLMQAKK